MFCRQFDEVFSQRQRYLLIIEFGHRQTSEDKSRRDLDYIKVLPLHLLPA